jgi:spore coat protein SA
LRLAIVHPEIEVFDEYEGGALARWTAEICRRAPADVEVTVVGRAARRHPYTGCRALVHPMRSGALARLPLLRRRLVHAYGRELLDHLRRTRYDVVHVHARPQWVDGIRSLCPTGRLVLHLQNDHLAPWDGPARRALLDRLDAVICCSHDLAMRSQGDAACATTVTGEAERRSKFHVLFNGVDVARFAPGPPKSDDPSRVRVIVYLGRLSPEKAPHLTMKAVLELRSRDRPVRMLIVGAHDFGPGMDTPYITGLRTLAARDPEAFEFAGYVHSHDLPGALARGDVYVHACTWNEPFGLATAEAMSCGLPPVVSRRGANVEVTGDPLLSFEPDDPPTGLVSLLDGLLAEPARLHRAAAAARARAVDLFDWNVLSKRYFDLLRSLPPRSDGRQGPANRT